MQHAPSKQTEPLQDRIASFARKIREKASQLPPACFGEQRWPTTHLISPIGLLLACCAKVRFGRRPQFVKFFWKVVCIDQYVGARHERLFPSPPFIGIYR